MHPSDLPSLNATLNSVATVLLICGWVCIKLKRKATHVAFMVAALLVSTAFLASYLFYHYKVGHVEFHGIGWTRKVYYPLLISHVFLAALILPMVIMTLIPALRQRFDKHKKIARWTLPVWLYVSVTGVLVYLMNYIWFA